MSQEALLEAVGNQRMHLLKVLGSVQCMKVAVRYQNSKGGDDLPELESAIILIEEEIERILERLEEPSLLRTVGAREFTTCEEETRS